MYAMTAALDYGIVEDDDGGDYDLAMDALAIERRATEFLLDDDGSTTSEGGDRRRRRRREIGRTKTSR